MRLNFEVVHVQHPTSAQFSMYSDLLGEPSSEQPTAPLTAPLTDPHTDVLPLATQAWAPRLSASHLAKGPNGIWYWRMSVPAVLRQRYPDLPKELRRSTQTAHRCHALAKARKMCLDFFVRYSNGITPMHALDQQTHQTQQTEQTFTLSYVNGVVQVQHSPHPTAAHRELGQVTQSLDMFGVPMRLKYEPNRSTSDGTNWGARDAIRALGRSAIPCLTGSTCRSWN